MGPLGRWARGRAWGMLAPMLVNAEAAVHVGGFVFKVVMVVAVLARDGQRSAAGGPCSTRAAKGRCAKWVDGGAGETFKGWVVVALLKRRRQDGPLWRWVAAGRREVWRWSKYATACWSGSSAACG